MERGVYKAGHCGDLVRDRGIRRGRNIEAGGSRGAITFMRVLVQAWDQRKLG